MIGIHEISFIIFICSIVIYFILMIYSNKYAINSQYYKINEIYKNLVISRLQDRNLNVVIQGLRNIVMGNSIYSSALLILLGILAGLYDSSFFLNEETFLGIRALPVGLAIISLNAVVIVFSLVNFILAIRMMNRLTLLFCAYPAEIEIDQIDGIALMEDTFSSGQKHLFWGIRGIFYLLPALSWIIHPVLFIVTTIIVTLYLVFFQDMKKIKQLNQNEE